MLVLHSNQIVPQADKVEQAWLARLGRARPTLGYIPSTQDPGRRFFQAQVEYYARHGLKVAVYLEPDPAYNPAQLPELLACQAIHLSGGPTFHFLRWLRQHGLLDVLRRYVADGGTLIGVSAGAILMTPTIDTGELCGDVPLPGDRTALGLVDFAFVPHLESVPGGLAAVQHYARQHAQTVYACRDGDGVIVDGDGPHCVGDVGVRAPTGERRA